MPRPACGTRGSRRSRVWVRASQHPVADEFDDCHVDHHSERSDVHQHVVALAPCEFCLAILAVCHALVGTALLFQHPAMATAQQPATGQNPPQAYRDIAATHIRDLSAVDAKLPVILRTSATAISQLTNKPIRPPDTEDSTQARRDTLEQTSKEIFKLVHEVRTALHAQIDALEAEGVVPPEQIKYVAPFQPPPGQEQQPMQRPHDPEVSVTNGGLGDMDVGILNARAGVRQTGGEEMLDKVKAVVEELVKRSEADGEEMDVDG